MNNLKTILLANMPTDEAIRQLKEECTPKGEIEWDEEKRCTEKADANVLDDWGDTCKGQQCCLAIGHGGKHMSSDGANGWVYFK